MQSFSLRGGYRDLFIPDSEGGLVLGAGFRIDFLDNYNIRFDYAWADYGRLNQAHRFTLSLGFK
jgi:opacity protein-like surface antigen